ncbi:MAG: NUDIX domain-containing protein [Thermomicrobiales bacterium]
MSQPAPEPGVRVRPGARVLVVNERDEILLIHERYDDVVIIERPDLRDLWVLPGGGIDPDEDPETAALRELWEETGLTGYPLGPCIWQRDRVVMIRGERVRKSERVYLMRVDGDPVVRLDDPDGKTEVSEYRWWSLDALRGTSANLSALVQPAPISDILAGDIPVMPIRLA